MGKRPGAYSGQQPKNPAMNGYQAMGGQTAQLNPTNYMDQSQDAAWRGKVMEGLQAQPNLSQAQINQGMQTAWNNRIDSRSRANDGVSSINQMVADGRVPASALGQFDPQNPAPMTGQRVMRFNQQPQAMTTTGFREGPTFTPQGYSPITGTASGIGGASIHPYDLMKWRR